MRRAAAAIAAAAIEVAAPQVAAAAAIAAVHATLQRHTMAAARDATLAEWPSRPLSRPRRGQKSHSTKAKEDAY